MNLPYIKGIEVSFCISTSFDKGTEKSYTKDEISS